MRILELGNYVVAGYAGMILAEQGHAVVKWTNGRTRSCRSTAATNSGPGSTTASGSRIGTPSSWPATGTRSSAPSPRRSSWTTSGPRRWSAGASTPARSPDGGLYGGSRCDPSPAIDPSTSSPRPARGSNTPPGCRSGRGTPSAACGWPSRRWPTGRRGISRWARRRACRSWSRGNCRRAAAGRWPYPLGSGPVPGRGRRGDRRIQGHDLSRADPRPGVEAGTSLARSRQDPDLSAAAGHAAGGFSGSL